MVLGIAGLDLNRRMLDAEAVMRLDGDAREC